ncbi:MAG: FAD-dependent oxidoreductase [Candidatus Aenigmarchaeota archaeon]|nr:FAD-dependent oxidoreductase [Candidatus Aenigmarchaeota archaeon]
MENKELYDLIIVGSGCSGYAGAMYAGRMKMRTLLIGKIMGGTIITTDIVENYPGFIRLTGQELADKLKEHALDYKDMVTMVEDEAIRLERKKGCFKVHTESGEVYSAKTILYATGTKHRELGIPGEHEYFAKGVHNCALCDGSFYRNKNIAVVGGSDSAAKEALLLTQWAKKVYIIYRGEEIHPEPVNMVKIEKKISEDKIEIINRTNIKEVKGDKFVRKVILDKPYNGSLEMQIDGVFVAIGLIPLSQLAEDVGIEVNKRGEIIINRNAETNVPGFYAAGDVVDTRFKQAITGVAEAVAAVYSAYMHIGDDNASFSCSDE